jgi:arginyl-tRNA synthetase
MAACAGDDPDKNVEVLIGQLVKVMQGDQEVRLSKRAGTIVTLQELVEMIGVDALRYTLARYPSDSPLTLDIEQVTRQTSDNPVFYVQYAHARLASILRNAGDLGIGGFETSLRSSSTTGETSLRSSSTTGETSLRSSSTTGETPGFDPSLLSHEKEGELLRALADFPRVVTTAAELREPHRVARYLEETASRFHKFYDSCRVLPHGDEEVSDLHRARLLLVAATKTVFANGLGLLGVSAPERM